MKHTSGGYSPRVIVHRCRYTHTHRFADGSQDTAQCPVILIAPGRCAQHDFATGPDTPTMYERMSLYRSEKAYD